MESSARGVPLDALQSAPKRARAPHPLMPASSAAAAAARARTWSFSSRLRSASELHDSGMLTSDQKGVLKDLILGGDSVIDAALAAHDRGDSRALHALVRSGYLESRQGSVGDIAAGLPQEMESMRPISPAVARLRPAGAPAAGRSASGGSVYDMLGHQGGAAAAGGVRSAGEAANAEQPLAPMNSILAQSLLSSLPAQLQMQALGIRGGGGEAASSAPPPPVSVSPVQAVARMMDMDADSGAAGASGGRPRQGLGGTKRPRGRTSSYGFGSFDMVAAAGAADGSFAWNAAALPPVGSFAASGTPAFGSVIQPAPHEPRQAALSMDFGAPPPAPQHGIPMDVSMSNMLLPVGSTPYVTGMGSEPARGRFISDLDIAAAQSGGAGGYPPAVLGYPMLSARTRAGSTQGSIGGTPALAGTQGGGVDQFDIGASAPNASGASSADPYSQYRAMPYAAAAAMPYVPSNMRRGGLHPSASMQKARLTMARNMHAMFAATTNATPSGAQRSPVPDAPPQPAAVHARVPAPAPSAQADEGGDEDIWATDDMDALHTQSRGEEAAAATGAEEDEEQQEEEEEEEEEEEDGSGAALASAPAPVRGKGSVGGSSFMPPIYGHSYGDADADAHAGRRSGSSRVVAAAPLTSAARRRGTSPAAGSRLAGRGTATTSYDPYARPMASRTGASRSTRTRTPHHDADSDDDDDGRGGALGNLPGDVYLPSVQTVSVSGVDVPIVEHRSGYIGAYTPEQRLRRIDRFLAKRAARVWHKNIKYEVRKNFADSRLRVKGRFIAKDQELLLRDFMMMI